MRFIACLLGCLIPAVAAHSADIGRRCNLAGAACVIDFKGDIVTGDAERMVQVLLEALPTGKSRISTLEIDSLGGDVLEALKIGELVRQNMLGVSIATSLQSDSGAQSQRGGPSTDRVCASACILVLMSAPSRSVHDARVGLHRPRLSADFYRQQSPSAIAQAHGELERKVRETVVAGGMPTDLIDRMMRHASNELLWLAGGDLSSLDSEAPWYQEMQIAVCGASVRSERISAASLQSGQQDWADAAPRAAPEASCAVAIATREQAKFRAAAPLRAPKQGIAKSAAAAVHSASTLTGGISVPR